MKKVSIFIFVILGIVFFTLSGEDTEEEYTSPTETHKKTYIDSPMNTYKSRIEAQNIANTINPSSSYLGSRLDARGSAKNAVKQSNQRAEAQDKAMEALMK